MEIEILKLGNLLGSPDCKELLRRAGPGTDAAHAVWLDIFRIKSAFGQNGQCTSLLLLEPACPETFPAVVDLSYVGHDAAAHGRVATEAALASLAAHGVRPEEVRSILVTHPHPDHVDPLLPSALAGAVLVAPPEFHLAGSRPFMPRRFGGLVECLTTPGHGSPHVSFVLDLPDLDLSVGIAGDLIMSHAHYLSLDHPLSFTDHVAGKLSVGKLEAALLERGRSFQMVIPGHGQPFFVLP